MDSKISARSQLWQFEMDCKKLGIKPTLKRFEDWLGCWFKEYYTYTMEDDEQNKPFKEWKPNK
jgi:hypothetical protein